MNLPCPRLSYIIVNVMDFTGRFMKMCTLRGLYDIMALRTGIFGCEKQINRYSKHRLDSNDEYKSHGSKKVEVPA